MAQYRAWYAELPESLRTAMEERWGPPPGDQYVDGDDFVIAGLSLGNVVLAIQPPRGYGDDPVGIYHDPELPPTHHYLACYWWLDRVWGADALVHLGKHGTLEWLPGKMLALSAGCAPDAALGDVPLVYPFVVNDPGEGVQAKRRAHATIVDHLVPPMMRAETYDELAELETLLDDYARLEVLDPPKLPALAARIWSAIERANLQAELGVSERPDDLGALVGHIDGYLCEVKDIQIKDGLHVLGRAPEGEQLRGLVSAMLRLGTGDVPGLRRAVGAAYGLDEPALVAAPGAGLPGGAGGAARALPGSGGQQRRRWSTGSRRRRRRCWPSSRRGTGRSTAWSRPCSACRTTASSARCASPPPRSCRASSARPTRSPPSSPRCTAATCPRGRRAARRAGRVDVLPTGRNFYSVDPRALPSELSWDVGRRLADALLERHQRDAGELPRMVGLVAWGTSAMRTQGDDVAEILALLGVRPVWHAENARVTGIEVIPLAELGRPRIDVTVRISGFFRDAFPHLVRLLDDAVATVAALDEGPRTTTSPRTRAPTPSAWPSSSATARGGARPRASSAPSPGPTAPGSSSSSTPATGARTATSPRSTRPGAATPTAAAWTARRRARPCASASRASTWRSRTSTRASTTSSTPTTTTSTTAGWWPRCARCAARSPRRTWATRSDPSRVVNRTLSEETRRVFRARVANPRWIASMIRHGYKGAAELSATVDYLFGYDATAGVAEDWMYEQVAQRYLLEPDVAAFMSRSNPWAARAIAERLLEAADRGMWASPPDETLGEIRDRYLALDGELEEAGQSPAFTGDRRSTDAIRTRGWKPREVTRSEPGFPLSAIVGQDALSTRCWSTRWRPTWVACSCAASGARRSRPRCARWRRCCRR